MQRQNVKRRPVPRYGLYVLLSMALTAGVYVAATRSLDRQGLAWASVIFAVMMMIIVITYRILNARHNRRVKDGLADSGPTVAEVWGRLRRQERR